MIIKVTAVMGDVVAYAAFKVFVVRMVGVLLLPVLVDVLRVAVRPCIDGAPAIAADVAYALRHAVNPAF